MKWINCNQCLTFPYFRIIMIRKIIDCQHWKIGVHVFEVLHDNTCIKIGYWSLDVFVTIFGVAPVSLQ